jgi:hypothetical protein
VQLTKSIDAKKAKTGEEVVAKVTQDMRNNAGTVLLPKDTKIVGHVTEAQARSKDQKESQLTISFDTALIKDGANMEMPMSIQAVIASPNSNNANNQASAPSSGGGTPMPSSAAGSNRQGAQGSAGGSAPPATQASSGDTESAPARSPAIPQITGNTQGVIGISNLNLQAASGGNQGSVLRVRSPARKIKNTTEMTPFMVKKAAFSRLRSSCRTSECS